MPHRVPGAVMTGRPRRAARLPQAPQVEIGTFRRQHLALAECQIETEFGRSTVTVDESESPLAWLARRRSRDGNSMIAPHQLQAGERLRTDFTLASLMPRTTSNWSSPVVSGRRAGGIDRPATFTDTMIAARQRVQGALDACGPEFSGLLLDVCCFLKGLENIERERRWPARSAKVVLQLALDRLARHYGYAGEMRGPTQTKVRTWLAEGAEFGVDRA